MVMNLLQQDVASASNPLDLLEELVSANEWAHDRSSEQELVVQVTGQWCDYHLSCETELTGGESSACVANWRCTSCATARAPPA